MRIQLQFKKLFLAVVLIWLSVFLPLPAHGQDNDAPRQIPALDVIILVDDSETMWNKTDVEDVRVNTANFLIDLLSSEQSGHNHRVAVISFGTKPRVVPFTLLDNPAAAESLKKQYAAIHEQIRPAHD